MKGMKKVKIAISVDKPLLNLVDSKVDKVNIRSRSQAIELFLKKGIGKEAVDTAVILLKGEHQKYALKDVDGVSLIKAQINFLHKNNITKLYIITQKTGLMQELYKELLNSPLNVEIVEANVKGNAEALLIVKDKLKSSFVVMSGDILNDFNLNSMIEKHTTSNVMAIIGLMTRKEPSKYGSAVLDGDYVISFREKDISATSNVVNAGIYIFNPEVFNLFDRRTKSIEKDIIPKLAEIKQLIGFFTHGKYVHLEE